MTSTLPIAAFFGVFAAELRSVQRLAANAPVAVAIQASGVPDQRFGYLDSTVDAMAETLFGSPMVLPGASRRWSRTQPPATSWWPTPCAGSRQERARRRPVRTPRDSPLTVAVCFTLKRGGSGRNPCGKECALLFACS